MAGILRSAGGAAFDLLVGVGGIGSGMFFLLEQDHTLGRNESRPAQLCDARDYNKLHIIAHYVAVLLGASPAGRTFRVLPVGCVGDDAAGERLLSEMTAAGMDTQCVTVIKGKPTLLSVCFQYPDGSGGNLTTSNSAAADLSPANLAQAEPLLRAGGRRAMVLAAPEVPMEVRWRLLEFGARYGAFRAAAFTSTEITALRGEDVLNRIDLLAINEDEAAALVGKSFDPGQPNAFLSDCGQLIAKQNPNLRLILSAGSHGVWGWQEGRWDFVPALRVPVLSTAGAGDALLGGVLAALAVGMPFIGSSTAPWSGRVLNSALELGTLLAALKVTSQHTIHPEADLDRLIAFASQVGARFPETMHGAVR